MKHTVTISQRRYKALLRAEAVAREVRYCFASNTGMETTRTCRLVLSWMHLASKHKYVRPEVPRDPTVVR